MGKEDWKRTGIHKLRIASYRALYNNGTLSWETWLRRLDLWPDQKWQRFEEDSNPVHVRYPVGPFLRASFGPSIEYS